MEFKIPQIEITRPQSLRSSHSYASDMTDAEWALVAPLLPPGLRLGRRRTTDLRVVVDALRYKAFTGCHWCKLPKDFPPRSTVARFLRAWVRDATLLRINHVLLLPAQGAPAALGSVPGLTHKPRRPGRSGPHEATERSITIRGKVFRVLIYQKSPRLWEVSGAYCGDTGIGGGKELMIHVRGQTAATAIRRWEEASEYRRSMPASSSLHSNL